MSGQTEEIDVATTTRRALLNIATDRWSGYTPRERAACASELQRRYPCADCGAVAGAPCKPDYGCELRSRHAGPDDLQRRADEIAAADLAEDANRMRASIQARDVTIIAALLHYGLACYDGRQCIEALRALGHNRAADVLTDALSNRIYSAPGVRDWQAEEERDAT